MLMNRLELFLDSHQQVSNKSRNEEPINTLMVFLDINSFYKSVLQFITFTRESVVYLDKLINRSVVYQVKLINKSEV